MEKGGSGGGEAKVTFEKDQRKSKIRMMWACAHHMAPEGKEKSPGKWTSSSRLETRDSTVLGQWRRQCKAEVKARTMSRRGFRRIAEAPRNQQHTGSHCTECSRTCSKHRRPTVKSLPTRATTSKRWQCVLFQQSGRYHGRRPRHRKDISTTRRVFIQVIRMEKKGQVYRGDDGGVGTQSANRQCDSSEQR